MKSQIHLIRHGITEGNKRRLYYGSADIPLANEGIAQLRSLAAQGIYPQVENGDFYTTGMLRTEQTLAILYGDVVHQQIGELREMSFGRFEMKSYEELKDMPEYVAWCSDETGWAESPDGESVNGFHERIGRGLKILMGKHQLKELSVRHSGKDAITTMVCHGGTIAAIMAQNFPKDQEHFYKWIPDPGHGFTLAVKNGDILGYEAF